MSKEKQIEEMAEIMSHSCEGECFTNKDGLTDCAVCEACLLYEAGYRKQSEDVTVTNVGCKSEWISVEERLPEENGYYLVYTKYGYIEVERYKTWDDDDLDGGYWWEFEGLVTHWMPLPNAPKGGE